MLSRSNQAVTGTILVADDKIPNRELMDELLSQRDSRSSPRRMVLKRCSRWPEVLSTWCFWM